MTTEIFVTYSHSDKEYLDDDSLLGHLKVLKRDGASFWDDRQIPVGSLWDQAIKKKIEETDIVLALVSQAFLRSDYCQNTEIANFLKRSRDSGLIIFPVILSACSWRRFDWLKERQFLPRSGLNIEQHYDTVGERKGIFQDICEALGNQVENIERQKQQVGDLPSLAMRATSGSVNTINDLNPQIISFNKKRPEEYRQYGTEYEGMGDRIVDKNTGRTLLTADDLRKLSDYQLVHICVFHEMLQRSYAVWKSLYLGPHRRNEPEEGKSQYDDKMRETIAEMKEALDRVFSFLKAAKLEVDDHYHVFRNIIDEETRRLGDN